MQKILTPQQMYEVDKQSTSKYDIPSVLLMENAASYTFNILKQYIKIENSIAIFSGVGNNGGDGVAIARHLISNGFNPEVYIIGDLDKATNDFKTNLSIIKKSKLKINHISKVDQIEKFDFNHDYIIDSLLGIGIKGDLRTPIKELVQKLNSINSFKISIDVPTGLNALNGLAPEVCFKADITITMFAPKTGHFLNDGKDYTGILKTVSIGSFNELLDEYSNIMHINVLQSYDKLENVSKFDLGRLLVIAGSKTFPGAASLCSNAAIINGTGLVHLLSPNIDSNSLSEVIKHKCKDSKYINDNDIDDLPYELSEFDCTVCGPGIGNKDSHYDLIECILSKDNIKVLDADAIRYIDIKKKYKHQLVITPHTGELANLLDIDRQNIYKNLPQIAIETAKDIECIIVLKGPSTIITDGDDTFIMSSGSSKLATAGSGDVLAGIISSDIARYYKKHKLIDIVSNSVLKHALAAQQIQLDNNYKSIIASDIIKGLKCL